MPTYKSFEAPPSTEDVGVSVAVCAVEEFEEVFAWPGFPMGGTDKPASPGGRFMLLALAKLSFWFEAAVPVE